MVTIGKTAGPIHPHRADAALPCAVAVGDGEVVFVDTGGRVWRWDGDRVARVAAGPRCPNAVALTSRWIFWTAGRGVYAVDRASGADYVVARCAGEAWGLCVDADQAHLFFTESDGDNGRLWRVQLADGAASEIARGTLLFAYPVLAGDRIYCANRVGPAGRYDFDNGSILAISLRGEPPITLASEQGLPGYLSLVGDRIHWYAQDDRAFCSVSVDRGPVHRIAGPDGLVWAALADAGGLYWLEATTGSHDCLVVRLDRSSGLTSTLGVVPNAARVLASDGGTLFAMDATGGGWAIDRFGGGVVSAFDAHASA